MQGAREGALASLALLPLALPAGGVVVAEDLPSLEGPVTNRTGGTHRPDQKVRERLRAVRDRCGRPAVGTGDPDHGQLSVIGRLRERRRRGGRAVLVAGLRGGGGQPSWEAAVTDAAIPVRP